MRDILATIAEVHEAASPGRSTAYKVRESVFSFIAYVQIGALIGFVAALVSYGVGNTPWNWWIVFVPTFVLAGFWILMVLGSYIVAHAIRLAERRDRERDVRGASESHLEEP